MPSTPVLMTRKSRSEDDPRPRTEDRAPHDFLPQGLEMAQVSRRARRKPNHRHRPLSRGHLAVLRVRAYGQAFLSSKTRGQSGHYSYLDSLTPA